MIVLTIGEVDCFYVSDTFVSVSLLQRVIILDNFRTGFSDFVAEGYVLVLFVCKRGAPKRIAKFR